jgi:hypothetical protein
MEQKPISRLNITQLKALIASSDSASEKERAKERLIKLTTKLISKNNKKNEINNVLDEKRVDPLSAACYLREYYTKQETNTTPTPPIEEVKYDLLSNLGKDYEIVEINIKMARKI